MPVATEAISEKEKNRARIDSRSWRHYLLGLPGIDDQPFLARPEDFAANLDVGPVISFVIQSMYRTAQTDAKGQQVEQCRICYYDTQENDYLSTPPIYGDSTSVNSAQSTTDLLKNGCYPYLEIHTHPSTGMFSADDYLPLLSSPYSGLDVRFHRGMMVLCPNIQVFAFATAETPLFSNNEALERFLAECQQQLGMDNLDKAAEMFVLLQRLLQVQAEIGGSQESDESVYKVRSALEHKLNTILVGLSRMLRVKCYFSTDTRHFTEWSA